MRNSLLLSSFCLLSIAAACSSDPAESDTMGGAVGAAGTVGVAGAAGAAGAAAGTAGAVGAVAGMGGGGTGGIVGAAGTSGAGGSAGTFVIIAGGAGAGGAAQAGAAGAAGAAQAGAGGAAGAAGAAQAGGGAGGGGNAAGACMNTNWTITATHECLDANPSCPNITADQKALANAIDGSATTRYTSGQPQDGTEEVVIAFGASVTISGITVTASAGDGPNMYTLEYSTDGNTFMAFTPPSTGAGSDNLVITFPATAMTAIKVRQTGTTVVPWWSILEITVQGCAAN